MNQPGEIGLPLTSLIAGQDYPNTYREFVTMFPDNEACMRSISEKVALARYIYLSSLWYKTKSMDTNAQSHGMFFMSSSDIEYS